MIANLQPYIRLLRQYLLPQSTKVAALAFMLVATISLQLLNPQLIRTFLDTAIAGGNQRVLLYIALTYLGVVLLQQVLSVTSTYVSEDVGWTATNHLRADLLLHCLRLDLSFFRRHPPGELIDRIDGDVTTLANFFAQLVIHVLGNFLFAAGLIVMLFIEDWRIGLVALSYALLVAIFLRAIQPYSVRTWRASRAASASLFAFLEERLAGTEDLRANGAIPYIMRRLYALMYNLLVTERRAALISSFSFIGGYFVFVLGQIGVLAIGAWLFLAGEMTIGSVYLVLAYIGWLETPLNEIRRQISDLQRAVASISRINEITAYEPSVTDPADTSSVPPAIHTVPAPSIRFDNVTFAYADEIPNTEGAEIQHVLEKINFDLGPGKVLGILGRTGSGKTTLTRLLFRLYDPTEGAILLNGQDLRCLSIAQVRHSIGMVTQDVQLFAASVRDNLTFFNARIPDSRILEVVRELGLDGWLARLPSGLDTVLEPSGGGLSAGESQLLAFSRVFLRSPGLVILDEASSRLDPATEQRIEKAIDRLLQNRTAIIIAHRLSTVQRADQILILEGGCVLEYGPRLSLAANPDSHFSRLLHTGMETVLA